jgi:5'-phosphate synthase pdxT subunit
VTVGILALQGDFGAHAKAFAEAGAETLEVRTAEDLAACEALVLPGGESTTMIKLLREENLWEPLRAFAAEKAVFATCAGAVLLASKVTAPAQDSLGVVDIDVERNAYGRQVHSHVAIIDVGGSPMEAVFIRAPIIRRVGKGVEVVAFHRGDPVLVRQGKHLVATFHPELSGSRGLQRAFLDGAKN